jgi:hypothetical protein
LPHTDLLAIRLLTRPGDALWWALELHGTTTYRGDGFGGPTTHEAEGELHPILVDALGDPVVAAWTSPSGDQRWYVIPDATDWATILDWLVQRGPHVRAGRAAPGPVASFRRPGPTVLLTYSGHRALSAANRDRLLDCIGDLIDDRHGGRITKRYLTQMFVARRTG